MISKSLKSYNDPRMRVNLPQIPDCQGLKAKGVVSIIISLIKPNRLLALFTVMLIWLAHERSFDMVTPRSLKLFASFKGLSYIA